LITTIVTVKDFIVDLEVDIVSKVGVVFGSKSMLSLPCVQPTFMYLHPFLFHYYVTVPDLVFGKNHPFSPHYWRFWCWEKAKAKP
jgi:hypothetical protein